MHHFNLVLIRDGLVHIRNGFLTTLSLTPITKLSHWELRLRKIQPWTIGGL